MAKFAHKLVLPKIVLSPLLAHLRGKGFKPTPTNEGFDLLAGEEVMLVGRIDVGTYALKVKLSLFTHYQLAESFMESEQIKALTNANLEPELRELITTDKSFLEAVKRLQALWKVKGQALAPLAVSPDYPDGSLGQVIVDPPTVNYPVHGE